MICLQGFLPIIKMGKLTFTGYNHHWIEQGIQQLLISNKNRDNKTLSQAITNALFDYLHLHNSGTTIDLTIIHNKITTALRPFISNNNLLQKITQLQPPMEVSLWQLSRQKTSFGWELGLLQQLKQKLLQLQDIGVTTVTIVDIKQTIQQMQGSKRWSVHCQTMLQQVSALLTQFGKVTTSNKILSLTIN